MTLVYTNVFAGSSLTRVIRRRSDRSHRITASTSYRRTGMDDLIKLLQECSKDELIKIIMDIKHRTIGIIWESVIANARLRTLEDKMNEILQHQEKLHEKMNAIPKERRVIWDSETREILHGFQKSNERYVKLSKLHDKIFEETYRK